MRSRAAETAKLWDAFEAHRTAEARNRLIGRYLHLVEAQARSFARKLPGSVTFEEMVSAGSLGLIDAIDGFDRGKGTTFETFSYFRIWGAMRDELRATDWRSRLTRERQARAKRARRELSSRLGRWPTEFEVAEHLGLGEAEFARGFAAATMTSLDEVRANFADGRAVTMNHALVDARTPEPEHDARREDLKELVTRGLSGKERKIITLHYYEGRTHKAIADEIGVSESRVSQMHKALMGRIRERLAEKRHEFAT